MTKTAREHLDECVERALWLYDHGRANEALGQFLRETDQHQGTSHISQSPLYIDLLALALIKGRETFEEAMKAFQVEGD